MTGKVQILRGLPGSGKSYWADNQQKHNPFVIIVSVDDYYEQPNGSWKFDPTKIQDAHNQCLINYMEFVPLKFGDIIVDNTNLTAWEIAPYYRLAEIYNREVEIIEFHCDPDIAWFRNIHNVPKETFCKMVNTLNNERLPPWWRIQDIKG